MYFYFGLLDEIAELVIGLGLLNFTEGTVLPELDETALLFLLQALIKEELLPGLFQILLDPQFVIKSQLLIEYLQVNIG
jgi:hypothetical protein